MRGKSTAWGSICIVLMFVFSALAAALAVGSAVAFTRDNFAAGFVLAIFATGCFAAMIDATLEAVFEVNRDRDA